MPRIVQNISCTNVPIATTKVMGLQCVGRNILPSCQPESLGKMLGEKAEVARAAVGVVNADKQTVSSFRLESNRQRNLHALPKLKKL
jgi:hypothetical protein